VTAMKVAARAQLKTLLGGSVKLYPPPGARDWTLLWAKTMLDCS
jgi:hypothetical protein